MASFVESVKLYHGFCKTSPVTLSKKDQNLFLGQEGFRLKLENGSTQFQITFTSPQPLKRVIGKGPNVLAVHLHTSSMHLELGPTEEDQKILASLDTEWETVYIDFDQPSSDEARRFSASLFRGCTKLASNHDLLRGLPDDITLNCKDGKSVTINSTVARVNSELFSAKERVCTVARVNSEPFSAKERACNDTKELDLTDFTVETVSKVKTIMIERLIPHDVSPDEVRLMYYLLIEGRGSAWKPLVESMTVDNCLDILILANEHKKPKAAEAAKRFLDANMHKFIIADPYAAKAAFAVKKDE